MSRYNHQIRPAPTGMNTLQDLPRLPENRVRVLKGLRPARHGFLEQSHPVFRHPSIVVGNNIPVPITGLAFYFDGRKSNQPPEHELIIFQQTLIYACKVTFPTAPREVSVDLDAPRIVGSFDLHPTLIPNLPYGLRTRWVQYQNELFAVADGMKYGKRIYKDSSGMLRVYDLGLAQPSAPTHSATPAGSLTGDYQWLVTDADEKGRESSPSTALSRTLAGTGETINFTWNTDTQVTTKYVYRTLAGGTEVFYRVGTITDKTITTFADTNLDSAITSNDTAPLPGQNDRPNMASLIAVHKNRLVLNDRNHTVVPLDIEARDRIQLSNLNGLTQFSTVNDPDDVVSGTKLIVSSDFGDEVTALYPFSSVLTIFKRRSIHGLFGDDIDGFALRQVQNEIGTQAPDTIKQGGNQLFFLSPQGPVAMDGSFSWNPIGMEVQDRYSGVVGHG